MLLIKINFRYKDTHRLKVKGEKMVTKRYFKKMVTKRDQRWLYETKKTNRKLPQDTKKVITKR